jgi:DNA-binding transcriptional ArsR family regulator
VSRIDPARETRLYVARQMDLRGRNLDEKGRALLAEDLRSPCYEEVAVFIAFSRLIAEARTGFVVLDTAPTGHTLLLLDSAYHRQIVGGYASRASGGIVTPLMRLGDPVFTRLLLVTLAETTPVSEATQLQADLRRAQIEPFSWVIDASLAAADSTAPILRRRIAADPPRRARARTAGGDRAVDGGRARRIGAAPSPRATRRAAPRRHARARALTGTSGRDGGASGHRGGGGHRPERAGLAFRRPDAISSCNDDATACTSIAWPAGAARWARGERVVTAGVSRAERPACSTTTGCEPADGSADLRPIEGPEADDELASLAKAVGHPARVQILRLLARRTACVCGDIVNELPLAQSTVSQHLKVLKEAGLVRGEVDGARVCYCLEPRALRRLKALVGGL